MKIIELNHVAIHVLDVEKSCEFYSSVLCLTRIPRPNFDFPGAWFQLGQHQELHLIGKRPDPVQSSRRGNHFALRVESLQPWENHLRSLSIEMRGPAPRPDGAMQIFISDLDGYIIELFEPSTPTRTPPPG